MDYRRIGIRLGITALLVWLAILGYQRLRDDVPMLFVYFIVIGGTAALLAAKFVLPAIGDAVGNFFYSSGEQVRPTEGMRAAAKLAQGDYEGAIAEHEKALADNPKQSFPVAEIAKICAEKLEDPRRALAVLRQHLEKTEWPEDDAAFLRFRMVDIHVDNLKDYDSAQDLLRQLITDFPNTRHSANAHHRLNEVQQAQFRALSEQRLKGGGTQ